MLAAVYAVGLVLGLLVWDYPLPRRAILALIWPLGVVAFAAAIGMLLIAVSVARPLVGLTLLIVAGAGGAILLS